MNYIELAKQTDGAWWDGVDWTWEDLEDFAKLVAAQEREECAKVCEEQDTTQYPRTIEDEHFSTAVAVCSAAIRARGEA